MIKLETARLAIRNWEACDRFDHPKVPDTHPHLKRHVFYTLSREDRRTRTERA